MKDNKRDVAVDPQEDPERYPQARKKQRTSARPTEEPSASDDTAAPAPDNNINPQSLALASTAGLIIAADIPAGPPGPPSYRFEAKRPVGGIQIPAPCVYLSSRLSPAQPTTETLFTYTLPATPTAQPSSIRNRLATPAPFAIAPTAQFVPPFSLPAAATQYQTIEEYHDQQPHDQYYDVTPPASTAMATTAAAVAPMTTVAVETPSHRQQALALPATSPTSTTSYLTTLLASQRVDEIVRELRKITCSPVSVAPPFLTNLFESQRRSEAERATLRSGNYSVTEERDGTLTIKRMQ